MSFILDALKKAEAERQRQTGPTLLEVRVTTPRRRLPLWTLIIGALLGVNIVLLLVFVLRRPVAVDAAAPAAPTPAATATAAPAAAAPPLASAPVPASAAPAIAAAAAPSPAPTAPASTTPTPSLAAAPAPAPSTAANSAADAAPGNPADYEPAVPANDAAPQRRAPDASARSEPPNMTDLGGDLPELRLDLHVYATRAADRYALINMHRVREGDVLPEGPRVVAIDRDGVEMSYRGTEFMLHPQ
jgi:general secretion pathway protein B